jgi:PAT family beta-lactamase induction signal transducer AmpG
MISILFLGFSAGIPLALTGLTLSMWLSRLGIDVKTIGLFALVTIPFSFKYLWSPIFDNIEIFYFSKRFGFRKSWLILIQICLIIAIMLLGQTSPLHDIALTAMVATLVSFFSATQDIIIDALRIEVLEKKEQALGASMYVYGYRIAMLVSGAGSLFLAEHIAWSVVYIIMSLSILVGIIAVCFLKEPACSMKRLEELPKFRTILASALVLFKRREFLYVAIFIAFIYGLYSINVPAYACIAIVTVALYCKKDQFKDFIPDSLLDFCNRPQWLVILLFVVFYKFSDTLLNSLQSKFYVVMGFSNSEIAIITKGFGFVMTLLGLFVGGLIYYRYKTFKSLLLAGILQILSNLVFLWVAETQHNIFALSVAIAVENFTSAINTVVVVAYLSSLCNINYTITQYALLSSLSNVGRTIMSAPAGYLVDSFGWMNFIWITAIVGIPALILLFIMKDNIYSIEQKNAGS